MVENVTQNKSGITINISVSAKIQKKKNLYEKDYSPNPTIYTCENGK